MCRLNASFCWKEYDSASNTPYSLQFTHVQVNSPLICGPPRIFAMLLGDRERPEQIRFWHLYNFRPCTHRYQLFVAIAAWRESTAFCLEEEIYMYKYGVNII